MARGEQMTEEQEFCDGCGEPSSDLRLRLAHSYGDDYYIALCPYCVEMKVEDQ